MAATEAGGAQPPAPLEPAPDLAGGEEREAMFEALRQLLVALYPGTTEARLTASMARLRAMLMRAAPGQEEAAALTNLCRHAARVLAR
jgi:tRNA C32,U32 (ribose-2'-O)-methylase TrmJ